MSEIRVVKVPSTNLLSTYDDYYIVKLGSADAIWHGSREISEESCSALANTYAFAKFKDGRLYLLASKVGMVGSIRNGSASVVHAQRVSLPNVKAMFCTVCGAFLDKGERHTCNAPRCSECGGFLSAVEVKNGRSMCKACRAKLVAKIWNYHGWHESPRFQKAEKRADVLHMGTEIEAIFPENHRDLPASVERISALANPDPWKHNLRFERDCTVTVEMITEPKTLRGYKESNELRSAMEQALADGHHITDSCGGHIHLDRAFFGKRHETASAMICYLVAVFWDEFFAPVSRRTTTEWCAKPHANKDDTVIDVYKKNSQIGYSDHHTAVNCGNRGTIELRFWAGTLDWNQKICDLDISRAIATWAKKTSCDNLMNADVSDIFKYIEYAETFDYIRSRVTNEEILAKIPG